MPGWIIGGQFSRQILPQKLPGLIEIPARLDVAAGALEQQFGLTGGQLSSRFKETIALRVPPLLRQKSCQIRDSSGLLGRKLSRTAQFLLGANAVAALFRQLELSVVPLNRIQGGNPFCEGSGLVQAAS